MEFIDLKNAVIGKSIGSVNFIFLCKDTVLIADQYVDAIANGLGLEKAYIHDLSEYPSGDTLFGSADGVLYVFKTETLDKQTPKGAKSLIVVCTGISQTVREDTQSDVVEFPKIEKWHLSEYAKCSCPGLGEEGAEELLSMCGGDPYRVCNEVDKLKIFAKTEQRSMLMSLIESGNFSDASNATSFQLSNALMRRDRDKLSSMMEKGIEIDPMELVGVLRNSLYNLIRVQMDPKATAASLKMSYKQFMAIKYNCNKYSGKEVVDLYRFITGIDYRLKSGQLDMDDGTFVDYIVCRFLSEAA